MVIVTNASAPDGYLVRPSTSDDAEAILKLATAYNTAVVGYGDQTLDDVRDLFDQPGFDRVHDSWLVVDGTGQLAGYGWALAEGDARQVEIEAVAQDASVGSWLLDRLLDRAREMAREHGQREVGVVHGVYRADDALRLRMRAAGFMPATSFHRMRADHVRPVPDPEPPAGVVLRDGTDEAVRRAAHAVVMASFGDHFGHVQTSYAEWHAGLDAKSAFDWSQLWLAELDGEPAGVCVCNDGFVEDEDCGYVAQLGVVPAARARGIAKYLLRRAFAVDAAAGRAGTILHVDTNNTTPALGLYESVGMRAVLVTDAWHRTLPVD